MKISRCNCFFLILTRQFICSNLDRNMKTEVIEEKSIRRNLYRVLRKTGVKKEPNIAASAAGVKGNASGLLLTFV